MLSALIFGGMRRAAAIAALAAAIITLGANASAQYYQYERNDRRFGSPITNAWSSGYQQGTGRAAQPAQTQQQFAQQYYGSSYQSGRNNYNYNAYQAPAQQRFASYMSETPSNTQEYSTQDYITPPPPGLSPQPYPIELFMSEGVGRFGDYTFPILGGTRAKPTPTGTFTVKKRVIDYWSRSYQQPMPYSIFFTDAHAIHYGALDSPSRGCVHVDYYTAQVLYFSTTTGRTKVIVRP